MKSLSTLLTLSLLSLCVACSSQNDSLIDKNTTQISSSAEQDINSAVMDIISQQDMAKKQQAYQVLLKYAEQNNPDAIYHLGQFYIAPSRLDGVITPDAKKAEELLLKSANMNHVSSQLFLGSTYKFGGHGFPRDKEKACYWMKKSVESESNPVIEGLMKDCP